MRLRLVVVPVIVLMVAACGSLSSAGPLGSSRPAASPTRSATPTPTGLEGTVALPALTAAQAAGSCLQDTGYWVLRGSATGPWIAWAEGMAGPEMQLAWPAGYRARFTPLLEVLAPDGTIVAREGTPITTACELGPRLVYADGLLPPNVAPSPVGGLPQATITPVAKLPASAVLSLEPGFAIFGPASAGRVGPTGTENAGGSIVVVDTPGAAARTIAAIPSDHEVYTLALSATWLVWVEQWYGPRTTATGGDTDVSLAVLDNTPGCPHYGQPVEWRVIAARRDGTATKVVANGANVRGGGECDAISGPGLALSGDRVAWTTEATTSGHPNATTLTVRSLTGGNVVRQVSSDGDITEVSLDDQALLYQEVPMAGMPGRAIFAPDDSHPPAAVPGASNGAVGGGRVAWASDTGDGSVWTAPEASIGGAVRVAAPVDPAFISQQANPLLVEGDVVAWIAQGVQGDTGTTRVAVWRPSWTSARLLTGYSQPEVLELGGGWLAWDSTIGWMDGPAAGTYRAPVSTLP